MSVRVRVRDINVMRVTVRGCARTTARTTARGRVGLKVRVRARWVL